MVEKLIQSTISASTVALSGQIDRTLARIQSITDDVSKLSHLVSEMQATIRSIQRQIEELKTDAAAARAETVNQFTAVNQRIDIEAVHRDDLQYGRRMSVRI